MDRWRAMVREIAGTEASATDQPAVAHFGDPQREYRAIADGVAVVDRSRRKLIVVTGADRASWLHNLTTNQIKSLAPGEGVYAFALNTKGRILFDLNVLVRAESILLDLDADVASVAQEHLGKYLILDDVLLADRSEATVRLGLTGPKTAAVMSWLEAKQVSEMAPLTIGEAVWDDVRIEFFRHDFCGQLGVELLVPVDSAVDFWRALTADGAGLQVVPAGAQAVNVHRIEAGIPWPGLELHDDVLPAETGQFDRAVSYTKGCYLGQEVVERMRTREAVTRRLVGFKVDGQLPPDSGAKVARDDGAAVGVITSSCRSPARDQPIALGYLKVQDAESKARLTVTVAGANVLIEPVPLPFR